MTGMNSDDLRKLADKYSDITTRALGLNYIVRDRQLQEEMLAELEIFRSEVAAAKERAIETRSCDVASVLFGFQCMTNSAACSLRVWCFIRDGNPEGAWGALVDAQEYASIALRMRDRKFYGIQEHMQRLSDIERVVFPERPCFLSIAFFESGSGVCSICLAPYEECVDHAEGLVYCGRLCERVNRSSMAADHVAIVDVPQDRRCVITHIATEDGRKRECLSWRVTDERFDEHSEFEQGLRVDAIILTTKRLDVD